MDLWAEILAQCLSRELVQFVFPNVKQEPSAIVEGECYRALVRIKDILEDDSLQDPDCFIKIEEIVSVIESLGSSAGNRHDF